MNQTTQPLPLRPGAEVSRAPLFCLLSTINKRERSLRWWMAAQVWISHYEVRAALDVLGTTRWVIPRLYLRLAPLVFTRLHISRFHVIRKKKKRQLDWKSSPPANASDLFNSVMVVNLANSCLASNAATQFVSGLLLMWFRVDTNWNHISGAAGRCRTTLGLPQWCASSHFTDGLKWLGVCSQFQILKQFAATEKWTSGR